MPCLRLAHNLALRWLGAPSSRVYSACAMISNLGVYDGMWKCPLDRKLEWLTFWPSFPTGKTNHQSDQKGCFGVPWGFLLFAGLNAWGKPDPAIPSLARHEIQVALRWSVLQERVSRDGREVFWTTGEIFRVGVKSSILSCLLTKWWSNFVVNSKWRSITSNMFIFNLLAQGNLHLFKCKQHWNHEWSAISPPFWKIIQNRCCQLPSLQKKKLQRIDRDGSGDITIEDILGFLKEAGRKTTANVWTFFFFDLMKSHEVFQTFLDFTLGFCWIWCNKIIWKTSNHMAIFLFPYGFEKKLWPNFSGRCHFLPKTDSFQTISRQFSWKFTSKWQAGPGGRYTKPVPAHTMPDLSGNHACLGPEELWCFLFPIFHLILF